MDRSDAIIVRRDPVGRPPERERYEPRSDGQWDRIDEEWTGCQWRVRGREVLKELTVVEGVEA